MFARGGLRLSFVDECGKPGVQCQAVGFEGGESRARFGRQPELFTTEHAEHTKSVLGTAVVAKTLTASQRQRVASSKVLVDHDTEYVRPPSVYSVVPDHA
jgi:hypothetical protein